VKYIILTLNNPEREPYKDAIRKLMRGRSEVKTRMVNGKDPADLNDAIDKWGFKINFNHWRPGEGGVWYSNIYAWEYIANQDDDVIVFEDDALTHPYLRTVIDKVKPPDDYDFVTYYVPYYTGNQIQLPKELVPTYQEHGMVCMRYSPKGARKILELLERDGLRWPVDIWLFKQTFETNELKGYSPIPMALHLTSVDFKPPSNIHDDDKIEVHHPGEK
jgi:GR25 family glycosyltransferase involved in LPS biosynthesis